MTKNLSDTIPLFASSFATTWEKSRVNSLSSKQGIWLCPEKSIDILREELSKIIEVSLNALESTNLKQLFSDYLKTNSVLTVFFICKSSWGEGPQDGTYIAFLNLLKMFTQYNDVEFKVIACRAIACPLYGYAMHPLDGIFIGMAQTLCRELPRIKTLIFSLSGFDKESLLTAQSYEKDISYYHPVCVCKDEVWVPHLTAIELPILNNTHFRKSGRYLIIGGGGGIGSVLAKYLASHYQADLLLIGRREATYYKQLLEDLNTLGATNATYIQLDIGEHGEQFIDLIKQLPLDGVVHSAISLQDRSIVRMKEVELINAIKPKVHGSYYLFEAIRNKHLDFVLFFSSIQSYTAHEGQANYTAACVVKDAIANLIDNVLLIPTKVINWGFWGSIGVAANDQLRKYMNKLQIGSIEPEEALSFIEKFLANNKYNQLAFVKASDKALVERDMTPISVDVHKEQDNINQSNMEQLEIYNPESPMSMLYVESAMAMEQYTAKRLQEVLSKTKIDEVHPRHELLWQAIQRIPNVHYAFTKEELLQRYPHIKSHIDLLEQCLLYYIDMLTGMKTPVSVLFPNGSYEILKAFYEANYLNSVVYKYIKYYFKQCDKKLTILEIGAGTGCTTDIIISELDDKIAAYNFTDVSEFFLQNAKTKFKSYDFFKYEILNIEQENVGLPKEYYDVVVATNVIHAVSGISKALHNIYDMLADEGVLILNEAIAKDNFLTVTFGLLEGWWPKGEQKAQRIPDTPLLTCTEWEKQLKRVGFVHVEYYGNQRQSVIIAKKSMRQQQSIEQLKNNEKAITMISNSALIPQTDYILNIKKAISSITLLPEDEIDETVPFDNYGVDSILALAIVEKLNAQYGKLPDTIIFEKNTVTLLASFIADYNQTEMPKQQIVDTSESLERIKQIIAKVTLLEVDQIEVTEPLENYGVDSILALTVVEQLANIYGRLPESLLFEQNTVQKIANYLIENKAKQIIDTTDESILESNSLEEIRNDHVVLGQPITPGTYSIALAYQKTKNKHFKNIRWYYPIPNIKDIEFQVTENIFKIIGTNRNFTQGLLASSSDIEDISFYRALEGAKILDQQELYNHFKKLGYQYGTSYQGIKQIAITSKVAMSVIFIEDHWDFMLSPAILDAGLQTSIFLLMPHQTDNGTIMLPSHLHDIKIYHEFPKGEPIYCYAECKNINDDGLAARFDFLYTDIHRRLLVEMKGLLSVKVSKDKLLELLSENTNLHQIE